MSEENDLLPYPELTNEIKGMEDLPDRFSIDDVDKYRAVYTDPDTVVNPE